MGRMVAANIPRAPGHAAEMNQLTPKEVIGIFRRHIFLIFCMTVLGFVLGGVGWYLMLTFAPKYTAQTFIRVLQPVDKDPMEIRGQIVNKDIQYGYRVSMANLITQQSRLQELIDQDRIQQTQWFQSFGDTRAERIQKAFKKLKKRLGASAQRDGEFIILSMTCKDKRESALIVNEMLRLFMASRGASSQKDVTDKLASLRSQEMVVQRDLAAVENSLDEIRRTSGIIDLEEREFRDTITLKLDSLEVEQTDLDMEIQQIRAGIGTLEKLATGPISEQIENQIERDPTMVMLTQQTALQEAQLAGLLTKFGENHKVVREARELINETKARRQARKIEIGEQTRQANLQNAQDQLIVYLSRLDKLEDLRAEATKRKEDLDRARVQYERGITLRDERQARLDDIKAQIDNWRIIHDDPETAKIQSMGLAPVPLEISSPKWQIYFPGGFILGLMFGVGLAFLIELLNDMVRLPRDVGRYLHIPLLGVIPDAAEDRQLKGVDLSRVVRQAPYSIVSESYRRFKTNLTLSESGSDSKVLFISSGAAGDGKTSVAINLSTAFAAEGKKVLLIDTNFWRPNLSKIFNTPQAGHEGGGNFELGLSNLLVGQCNYDEVIRPSGIEGFDIIGAGSLPSNPGELLGSGKMRELIGSRQEHYDYIIFDGPPVLLVSDTKTIARLADSTILVFNAGTTRRGAAARAIRELREVNVVVAGCVLFGVKALKGGYFHEQFKSQREYQKLQLAGSA